MTRQAGESHDQLVKEGEALHRAGRYFDALASFGQALQQDPGEPGTLLAIGTCRHDLGRFREAVAAYSEALELDPGFGPAYNNRGNAYLELGLYEECALDYLRALELMPSPELYAALATALQALGRLEDAKLCCERALALDSGCAEAHCNLAQLLLLEGEYRRGWREFEWRWRKRGFSSPARGFARPLWGGSSFAGQTLLLHAEQGFGDAIQFARYLPLAAALGGRVVVECHRELVSLFSRIEGVAAVLPFGAPLPPFDLHAPFMTLPLLFDTTLDAIPGREPYLSADPVRAGCWQERLEPFTGLKVGVVWTGSSNHKNDRERSLPFAALAPLWSVPARFFSLQMGEANRSFGECQALNRHDLTRHIVDFDDTAAFVSQLDLVLSVDTAVAHLAAALGKPVFLMTAKAPDWRWLLERSDSPWYPSLRVFRQSGQGDWAELVARVKSALLPLAVEPGEPPFQAGASSTLLRGLPASRGENTEAARQLLRQALELNERGRLAEAEGCLRRARELCPKDLLAAKCLGLFLAETRRFTEAAELYREFLQGAPDTPEILLCLGEALQPLERFDEAELCLAKAARLAPGDAEAAYRLGILLHLKNEPERALAHFLRSDALAPGNPKTLLNIGIVRQSLGMAREAQPFFEQALVVDPGYALARWNLAQVQLVQGDFARGLANSEARFLKSGPVPAKYGGLRRWQGEPLGGRRLLVWAEQAFGDVIQFARYLPLLARQGGEVHFDCGFESLLGLTRGMEGVSSVFAGERKGFEADFQVPLLSLPGLMGTRLETIPARVPYLEAPPESVSRWFDLMRPWGGVRVGLVWAGRREPDPNRSASLAALAPLAAVPGVTFFSLQFGEEARELERAPEGMRIVDLTPSIGEFADTAAAMRQLDLVISIDTASAHLAGALGVPTWVLLPFAPDWRWLLEREDSPWYPTATLFRQRRRGDWDEVAGRVGERLRVLADSRTAGRQG